MSAAFAVAKLTLHSLNRPVFQLLVTHFESSSELQAPMSTVAEWKDQGNAEFRAGRFKKAAELYSKAIELDSESAVLYRC